MNWFLGIKDEKKSNGRYISQSTATDSFTKEPKTSRLSEKVRLLKWIKNAGEGGKVEGLMWQGKTFVRSSQL